MGYGVVAGDAGAVIGRNAVPVGIGAIDARIIVHSFHTGIVAVVRKPLTARDIGEQVIGIFRKVDDVLNILIGAQVGAVFLFPYLK